MGRSSPLAFAAAARTLAAAARAPGLQAPSFRSPPGVEGADRTVRRRPDGGTVVAVRLQARPVAAVVADMVEGVVVANRLTGARALRCRRHLVQAVGLAEATMPADEAGAGGR